MKPENGDSPPVEHPRYTPEIIPPGERPHARGLDSVFVRFEQREGLNAIYIARPGWPWIVLGLLAIAFLIAVLFTLVAGFLLLWLPVAIAVVLVTVGVGALRHRLNRLRMWWGRRG